MGVIRETVDDDSDQQSNARTLGLVTLDKEGNKHVLSRSMAGTVFAARARVRSSSLILDELELATREDLHRRSTELSSAVTGSPLRGLTPAGEDSDLMVVEEELDAEMLVEEADNVAHTSLAAAVEDMARVSRAVSSNLSGPMEGVRGPSLVLSSGADGEDCGMDGRQTVVPTVTGSHQGAAGAAVGQTGNGTVSRTAAPSTFPHAQTEDGRFTVFSERRSLPKRPVESENDRLSKKLQVLMEVDWDGSCFVQNGDRFI